MTSMSAKALAGYIIDAGDFSADAAEEIRDIIFKMEEESDDLRNRINRLEQESQNASMHNHNMTM